MLIKNITPSPRRTLDKLAKDLGVSKATISLVLNGKGRIGAATRQRVKHAIQQLDYQPRSLKARSKTAPFGSLGHVAIVCPVSPVNSGRNDTLDTWILSAQQEIRRLGGHASLFVGAQCIQDDRLFETLLRQGEMDGILLMGVRDDDGYMEVVQQAGRPVVVINRRPVHEEFSYVAWDNIGGSQRVAEHLIGLGHHHLAVIYNDAPGNQFHHHRCEAFIAAMARQGMMPVLVQGTHDFSDQANQDLMRKLSDAGATAVFATNDVRAVGLLNACEHLGIAVPQQMSIVGFDNTQQRSAGGLRPTSAGCTEQNISVVAVGLLNQLLHPNHKVRFLASVLDVDVVVHDTTGPCDPAPESNPIPGRQRAAPGVLAAP